MTHPTTPARATRTTRGRAALLGVFLASVASVLVPVSAARAAAPEASSATVWALPRYEVAAGGGGTEYQIPIDLLAFASDADGDVLTFTVEPATAGTVNHLGDGLALFRIDVDELAALEEPASFDFTVSDRQGGSATATVSIEAVTAPDVVEGVPDMRDVATDRPTPLPVLDNDHNADMIASFTEGTRGEVTLDPSGTVLIFTPEADFEVGDTDTFTYRPANATSQGSDTDVTVTGVAASEPVRGRYHDRPSSRSRRLIAGAKAEGIDVATDGFDPWRRS